MSDSPFRPLNPDGKPFTIDRVESSSALHMGDEFYVYFDQYTDPKYYGAMNSVDLEHWQDISPQVSLRKTFPKERFSTFQTTPW